MKTVEIFTTNVRNNEEADRVTSFFLKLYPMYKINFDLEDEENILRVEANDYKIEILSIIEYMTALGYSCKKG